jgi:ketosteroid isomerase-like protein
MKRAVVSILAGLISVLAVSAQTNRTATDAIRKADQDWLRVFAAKDLKQSVDFVLADGSVLAPNAPIANGPEAIGKLFAGFFSLPELKIEWTPTKVDVARSGELGYSTGNYRMSFKDPTGKTVEDHGKYVTLWKQQGGKWKVAYDIFNTDLAATQ